MKFFQVLTTNKFQSSLDRQYVNVYNYASLAEALKTLRLYEDKDAVDGYTYTDNLGRKVVQYHLNYEENGGAVISFVNTTFPCEEVLLNAYTLSSERIEKYDLPFISNFK